MKRKSKFIISATGMPKDQLEQAQAELNDPNSDKYIWIFDKPNYCS